MGRVQERGLVVQSLISKSPNNQIFDDAAGKEQEATVLCSYFFMDCPKKTNTTAKEW